MFSATRHQNGVGQHSVALNGIQCHNTAECHGVPLTAGQHHLYANACFKEPEALCFQVFINLSIHLSTLVNPITSECMKGILFFFKLDGSINYDVTDYILGFTGQRSGSPHDQIWAKIQLWSHNSIQMYQVAGFVNETGLLGQC